jgi:hypothetical protein
MPHTAEAFKVNRRMLALAVGRPEEQCGRWPGTAKRPLVANVCPDPPSLGPTLPGANTGSGVSSP